MNKYNVIYSDISGSQNAVMENDGITIRLFVGNSIFSGRDFDSLELSQDEILNGEPKYTLNDGVLCGCTLQFGIDVKLVVDGICTNSVVNVMLILGTPVGNGGISEESIQLSLSHAGKTYTGKGKSGWFEGELEEIQSQLPNGVYIRSCINCMYSDYSPYGHGLFGSMMCFKNIKDEYVKVTTKDGFWSVHDRYDRLVQETYVCDDFIRRTKGVGYRG